MKSKLENVIKSQDIIGLAIFSVTEGQKLGVIKDIFLEPGKKSPLFLIEDEEWYKGGKVIKGSDVMKIGEEALVIESKDKMEHFSKVSNIESMLRMNTDLTSISVVNPAQEELGKINEYLIDKEKIEVVSLEISNGRDEPIYWPAESISGFKDGALVVLGEEQSDEAAAETEPEAEAEGLIREEVRGERREVRVEGQEQKEEEKVEEKPEEIEEEAEEKPEEQVEDKVEEKPEEEVTPTGRGHPEEAAGRREDLSKNAVNGNGEEKSDSAKASDSAEAMAGKPDKEEKDVSDKEAKENVEKPEVKETVAVAAHKDLKQILEERQDKFLLGKKVDRDITTDDGTIIIQKGETITKEVLEEAKGAHKYIVLSFCVKTDLIKRS